MIASTIATVLVAAAVAWGIYVTKHAHEYPEWFEDDVMWDDIEDEKEDKL